MRQEEWLDFLEPDAEDLLEAEAFLWPKKKKGKLPKKKWMVLFAACLLFAALSTAVLAAKKTGGDGLLSWFQVADDSKRTIYEQLQLEPGMSAEDAGYTILVTDAASDGQDVYIMLDLTAPEGTELGDVYGLDFRPGLLSGGSQDADTADFLRGGWYAEVLAQPAPNRVTMLVSVSPSTRVDGKNLLLSIQGIREMADGEDRVLAEGEWELVLKIPVSGPKRIRQWTKANLDGEIYYVTSVEMTPLGIRIRAVKSAPLPVFGKESSWSKLSFEKAVISVQKKDGTRTEAISGSFGSSFLFCEKSIRWQEIVDAEEIASISIGGIPLKIEH